MRQKDVCLLTLAGLGKFIAATYQFAESQAASK
jgi:hypothetical protein